MGYYVDTNSKGETLNSRYKAKQLIEDGAVEVDATTPVQFQPNLICVVSNAHFDAAGYCYSEAEFESFKRNDGRYKIWITHPMAKELSGYKE